MLTLRALELDYEAERAEAARAEVAREALADRVAILRAETSVRGIGTMLALASLAANVKDFPKSFSMPVGAQGGHLVVEAVGKVWHIVECDAPDDADGGLPRKLAEFSHEEMLDAVLDNLDMPGSEAVGDQLLPSILIGDEEPGGTQIETLLDCLPPSSIPWVSRRARDLARSFDVADHKRFASRIEKWHESRKGMPTKPHKGDKAAIADTTAETMALWVEAGHDPDDLLPVERPLNARRR